MAKRKKRAKAQHKKRERVRKVKSAVRSKAHRMESKSARARAGKRTVAKARGVKPKRARVRKAAPVKVQPMIPPSPPEIETVTVDVIEEIAPGVITVTEFEETEVREQSTDRGEPEDG